MIDSPYGDALGFRNLDNGDVIVLTPMLFNYRLNLGKQLDGAYSKGWDYPRDQLEAALNGLNIWDGRDDPPDGWVRSFPPYYRRRPSGDSTWEYIAP